MKRFLFALAFAALAGCGAGSGTACPSDTACFYYTKSNGACIPHIQPDAPANCTTE